MSPHSIMPLLVGREASIKAIESAVNDYGKRICLVTQREPELEKPDPADLYAVGVVGRVLQYMRLPEGPIKVLFEGLYRISWRPLTPEDQENPFGTDAFPKVVVTPLPIMRNDGPETEALVRATKEILAEYAHTNKKLTPEILSAVSALRDPGQLADTILPLLKIEYPKKQEALELADPGQRLEKVYEFLNTEMERVSMERRIKSRVKDQMDKNQREYYLSEQIKAINKEMGREDDPQAEIAELEQMLKAKNMPEEAREKGMSELKKLRMMAPASAEYAIVRNYVDWILELPWNDMRETSIDIPEARAILDADHFGLEKPKQRILPEAHQRAQRPHPLPRRASRRGQDLAGPLRRHGHGARIRAPVPRRGARRSRNPRPPAHLRGSHARQDHHGPQTRQVQQPVVLP